MVDFALALPEEICQEMGRRVRARRLTLNISVDELALRVGISNNTLGNFERTGRCTFETFVRVLEALHAMPDLASVLVTQSRSIEDMRKKAAVSVRQRAYTKTRKTTP
jgi:transcriptional regulator with XRE-family HTH domain